MTQLQQFTKSLPLFFPLTPDLSHLDAQKCTLSIQHPIRSLLKPLHQRKLEDFYISSLYSLLLPMVFLPIQEQTLTPSFEDRVSAPTFCFLSRVSITKLQDQIRILS